MLEMLTNFDEIYLMSITSEAKQEVVRLLALNKKIEAVKYLKETFQVSLLDAKNLVEAIEQELAAGSILIDPSIIAKHPVASQPTELSYEEREKVLQLLHADKKIEAIKFVHKNYKIGLKKALTWVEEVEQTIPSSMRSSKSGRIKRKTDMVFPRIIGGVALILVVVMFFLYRTNQKIISQNIYVKGKVVALESDRGDGFAPIIEYEWEGKNYRYISKTRTTPSAFDVGESVGMYLDRENPAEPLIDSFTERWSGIAIIGVIASFAAFFSIMLAKIR